MSCNSDAVSVTSTFAGERTPPRVDEVLAVVVEERGGGQSSEPPPPTPPKGGRGEGGIFLSEEEETGQNGQSPDDNFITTYLRFTLYINDTQTFTSVNTSDRSYLHF